MHDSIRCNYFADTFEMLYYVTCDCTEKKKENINLLFVSINLLIFFFGDFNSFASVNIVHLLLLLTNIITNIYYYVHRHFSNFCLFCQ